VAAGKRQEVLGEGYHWDVGAAELVEEESDAGSFLSAEASEKNRGAADEVDVVGVRLAAL
jgi:hypothetical protein